MDETANPVIDLGSKVQIATRVDRDLLSKIEKIQDDMQADRSETIRRLLEEGARQYELKRAVELLCDGKVTVSRGAEIAGVSVWDLLETMRIKKIPIPYSGDDLRRSLEPPKMIATDSTPLIYLAKLGHLRLPCDLFGEVIFGRGLLEY